MSPINRVLRSVAAIIPVAILVASCGSSAESSTTTSPREESTVSAAVPTTAIVEAPSTSTPNPDDVCRPNAGPNVRLPWATLPQMWADLDGSAAPAATLDRGDGQDSGQFTFDDGTIVQATVNQNKGEVVELFVISPVNPQDPMADLPAILSHWVELLSLTEPRLTPQERVDLLSDLGVVGDNLTLLEMNGTVDCRQRTYEVVFDVDLAAFVFGVDLAP
ncbi:MAG: hypothetical protein OEY55_04065 [Acidimicrobiia bacterium]|nr:hypothetical protein [Acidimicrobiia bacterium]MDH5503396.1 hypothetical protein [Acidimicrobiia bacterium]